MNVKINSEGTVAVDQNYYWNDDMSTCPIAVKVQLLGAGGVAAYATYNGKDPFWKAWAPLPKRRPSAPALPRPHDGLQAPGAPSRHHGSTSSVPMAQRPNPERLRAFVECLLAACQHQG